MVAGGASCTGRLSGLQTAAPTACDETTENQTVATALETFRTEVFPAMTEGSSECLTCHTMETGRQFLMSDDPVATFHQARAAGFFRDDPGSILSRVTSRDVRVRMPRGALPWSAEAVDALSRVSCMVQDLDRREAPIDEQFPPALLEPYTGAVVKSYDNPFINYVQLKNKVHTVFGDDWVRGGEDQFEKNIGLFGGVNFTTHFVEARGATSDFLLAMDLLAPGVCQPAADQKTGPFVGIGDLDAGIVDLPAQSQRHVEIETLTVSPATGVGSPGTDGYFCYTNCSFTVTHTVPAPGVYRVSLRGRPTLDGNGVGPEVSVSMTGATPGRLTFSDDTRYEVKSAELNVTQAGMTGVTLQFDNDAVVAGGDRNLTFDWIEIVGPLGQGTGTTLVTAAKTKISQLYDRLLYRPPSSTELDDAYTLLNDLQGLGSPVNAWSGVCEVLVRHPDFLFTQPPSAETATPDVAKQLRWVTLTQRALGRPPTEAELTRIRKNQSLDDLVHDLFRSPEFRSYYFSRIQLRIESQGTLESDEPARLWTYVTTEGRPFAEVLTAEYSIDAQYQRVTRPAHHGKTGLLTTKGYLNNKPGLPHYNFPARVFSGFMGSIFEVPPSVFDLRGTSTPTSTVDPTSTCYSCHQILTPLAHQRLKWADDGTYRETDARGPIDDTDRGLVEKYPYRGAGLEAFTTKAVKKEAFIRRMINTQYRLLTGRELRSQTDERVLYRRLWLNAFAHDGDMRSVLEEIARTKLLEEPR